MVVSYREILAVTLASVVLSSIVVAAIWPAMRSPRALLTVAIAAALGIVVWNLALNVSGASGLNVDSPFLGLSVQDVGSGVAAFIVTFLVLQFVAKIGSTLGLVLAISAVVGVMTVAVDLFA